MGGSSSKKALLIIDVQVDFTPGGSLAVDEGDVIIPIINDLKSNLEWNLVVLSQDWHPPAHGEEAKSGEKIQPHKTVAHSNGDMLWPDHCVQGSKGAEFHPNLVIHKSDIVVQKGKNPVVDSYSAFADNNQQSLTGLYDILDKNGITDVYVCGIATDYCVNFTCQDAVIRKDKKGKPYRTYVIEDACRGVDPVTIKQALLEMSKKGVEIIQSKDLL